MLHRLRLVVAVAACFVCFCSNNHRLLVAAEDGSSAASSSYTYLFPKQATIYADSQATYYSGYQQAWRMLGYYVDCGSSSGDDHHRDRELNGNNNNNQGACIRYLLWAAVRAWLLWQMYLDSC
jgi:hypothetical protein